MSKTKETHESQASQDTETYFFPNVGEAPAFSCQAASVAEAEKANAQHVKDYKETT